MPVLTLVSFVEWGLVFFVGAISVAGVGAGLLLLRLYIDLGNAYPDDVLPTYPAV